MKIKRLTCIMDQYIAAVMKLDLSWKWWAIPASWLSRWVVENHDNWRHLAVARVILQAFIQRKAGNRIERFCKVSSCQKCYLRVLCQPLNTWQCNVHDYSLQEARCLMNHIFDTQWSLHCFSYIPITHFQASPFTPWSVFPCSLPSIRITLPSRHEALFWWFFSPLLWA